MGSLEGMVDCVMFEDSLSCMEFTMKTTHQYLG